MVIGDCRHCRHCQCVGMSVIAMPIDGDGGDDGDGERRLPDNNGRDVRERRQRREGGMKKMANKMNMVSVSIYTY